jgi:drug/metabolite transporter (DMT)-like permease
MTVQPLFTKLSQNEDGTYDYVVLTSVLCTEFVKLAVSLGYYALFVPPQRKTHHSFRAWDIVAFAIPAAVYALNNALVFMIISELRPSAFQILGSFKTVFTLVLFRIVLQRIPTNNQYVAVLLLAAGAAVSRLGSVNKCNGDSSDGGALGVVLTLVSCLASSMGGVANEALLKKDGGMHSLSLQNSLLYAFGVVVNSIALFVRNGNDVLTDGFCVGDDLMTVLLIAINALTGLSISAVLKWNDNISRVFAHTGAIVISMTVEMLLFALPASPDLVLAGVIVSGSALIYANDPPPRPAKPPPTLLNSQISVQLRAANAEV